MSPSTPPRTGGLAGAMARALGREPASWTAAELAALEAALAEHLELAETTWSSVHQPREPFVAYLAARLPACPTAPAIAAGLDELAVSDLYLCAACAAGDAAAIAAFDRAFGGEIERAVARTDRSGDLADDVRQMVHEKLFVADAGAARGIESYQGRGPLGRWLWVLATREALMWRRRHRREIPLQDGHLGIAEGDIELDYLKREYRAEFRIAFAEAMTELPSKQRNLLYYHFVRRLNIDQIGALYRVHRVTAFRWLRGARGALLAATRRRLAARLDIAGEELESILRLVQSRLEVSVERILTQARDATGGGSSST